MPVFWPRTRSQKNVKRPVIQNDPCQDSSPADPLVRKFAVAGWRLISVEPNSPIGDFPSLWMQI